MCYGPLRKNKGLVFQVIFHSFSFAKEIRNRDREKRKKVRRLGPRGGREKWILLDLWPFLGDLKVLVLALC